MAKSQRWLPFVFALIIVLLCLACLSPQAFAICSFRAVLVMLVWVVLEPPVVKIVREEMYGNA